MMIHYAVTEGCYSDYHIVTICSDKQKAENIAKIFDAEVEEFDDGEVNEGVWFEVRLNFNWKVEPLGGTFYPKIEDPHSYVHKSAKFIINDSTRLVFFDGNTFFAYVKASSTDQAQKAAYDLYAELKAIANGV